MLLMVSVQDLKEAQESVQGGADIVDVKDLREVTIGSNVPSVIKEVRDYVPQEMHVSVTLGVVPNQPGTIAMAVYGAACLKASSIKVGFLNTDYDTALTILKECRRALKGFESKLIAATFADAPLYHGLAPERVVDLAEKAMCNGILIDTVTKDGRNLFDFMDEKTLKKVVDKGKSFNMSTALSGSLKIENFDELSRINPHIVGVRGAVCTNQNRENGRVEASAVKKVKDEIEKRVGVERNPICKSLSIYASV